MRNVSYLAILVLSAAPLQAQTGARAVLISASTALSNSAFTNGLAATFPAALAADGVVVWPGAAVVQGSAAATELFRRQVMFAEAKFSWQPLRIEMAADSSLAVMTGVSVIDTRAAESFPAIHRIGRYLAAWKRVDGAWQLSAFCIVNLLSASETIWTPATGPLELPMLPSLGPAAKFIAADSTFAADAGANGTQNAFIKWAAADATVFAPTGEVNLGPDQIGAIFAGDAAKWAWGAVAAGSSNDGTLGWTVGQATITRAGDGPPSKSKYLTLWRKMPDGTIRFIADGGNARP
jgi:ketosteroid isomerase-like protein